MNEGDNQYQYYNDQITKMEKMVTSLNDFHSQTQALDANYQAQVEDLNTIIQSLFESSGTFTGSAANTLQDVVSKYLQTEHSFTGHVGDTSPHLEAATRYCQVTANNIEKELQQLYRDASAYSDELANLSSESFLQQEGAYLSNSLFGGLSAGSLASDVRAYEQGQCFLPPQTVQVVEQMQQEKSSWEGNFDILAAELPPVLPPMPTDPAPFQPTAGSNLYPVNEQSLDDLTVKLIGGQLRAEGYTVDDAEIEALLRAGYKNPEDIKAILRIGRNAFYQYALTTVLSRTQIKDLARSVKQAQKTIDDAQRGVVKRVKDYKRNKNSVPSNYHGRLPASLEQEILSHPDSVYVSTGAEEKFTFRKGGNVVITLGTGPYRGQIITSYGPGGPRGKSGANIYGGSEIDPGVPITDEMIREGKIRKPQDNPADPPEYEPPAIPIIDNTGN